MDKKNILIQNELNRLDMIISIEKLVQTKLFNLNGFQKPKIFPNRLRSISLSQPNKQKDQYFFKLKENVTIHNKKIILVKRQQSIKVIQNLNLNLTNKLLNFNPESPNIVSEKQYFNMDKPQDAYPKIYKNSDKLDQQSQFLKQSAPALVIHNQILQNIFPSKIGLFHEDDLNLNNLKFGDKHINALACGLEQMPDLKQIKLNNNRITQISADIFLQKLSHKLRSLNIGVNNIGFQGCQRLNAFLQIPNIQLLELNIEENKLNDNSINLVLQGIYQNQNLKILNLSKNFISDLSCNELSRTIKVHPNLRELYIHWNKINAKGGSLIFEALTENNLLKVLDISWNDIGSLACAMKVSDFLKKNKCLVHLDMSNNKFNLKQTQLISEALNHNHTIFGFHFAGHQGQMDEQQFLIVDEFKQILQHNITRIKGVTPINLKNKIRYQLIPDQQICWICDGWQQQSFQWPQNQEPVFLHLEIELFEGKFMKNNTVVKMVPIYEFYYFFTVEDEQSIIKDFQNVETILEQIDKIRIQDQIVDMIIQQKNVKQFQQFQPIFDNNYNPLVQVLPRTKQELYTNKEKKIKKWNYKNSIFNDFRKTTEEFVQNCFEFDWSHNRLYKTIKNKEDLQNVRNHFKQHYQEYIDCYKCYSVLYPVGDVFAITMLPFQMFVEKVDIVDLNLTANDVTLKWAATTQSMIKKDNIRNPERGIVRYQFIEVLTRLAEQKFVANNICGTYFEAVSKMYTIIKPELQRCDTSFWRNDKYWNEECEQVLIRYKVQIEQLFNLLIKIRVTSRKSNKYLYLEDIIEMVSHIQTNLSDRDVQEAMNQSMMLQIDELNFDRHIMMNHIEFCECLARLADKVFHVRGRNVINQQFLAIV